MDEIKKEVDKSIEPTLEELEQQLEEIRNKKVASLPRCGHVNSHSRDVENNPDNLACTLAEGHSGKHKALHSEKDPENPEKVRDRKVAWSDAAGKDFVPPQPRPPGWTDGASGEMVWKEK